MAFCPNPPAVMRRPINAGVDSGADHTHLTAQITMKMKAACACTSFDSRSNYSKTKIWQVAIAIKFMNGASPSSVICQPPLANPYSPPTAFFLHWRPGFQPSDAERDCSANIAPAAPKEQPPRKLSGQRIGIALIHTLKNVRTSSSAGHTEGASEQRHPRTAS